VLTKIDRLDGLPEIPVCVGYELDGKPVKGIPDTQALSRVKPVYQTLAGWENTRGLRQYRDLPAAARNYVEFIENALGVPVTLVGNGPARGDIIARPV
jgi:adenylosuccinate synthase